MLYSLLAKLKEVKDRKNGILSISFYKKNGNWYVDVPELSEEDAILIGGSEQMLLLYLSLALDHGLNKQQVLPEMVRDSEVVVY